MARQVSPLDAMEQVQVFVATMTGVKQQFIDAGWDERAAEQMTIEALRQSNGGE